ncbi:hypothetical protein BOTNAR_0652g00060 [Botryotinia narcissicola]|uniref:Uncharacterized protein n=1 Tax=Botryotinia narcissicola TaxID=278944 RepID=A0A4Z1H9T5_9HELO|nr:hypothetical protein BOTNAR_0652g00060 [Botryotinia narcissicola]
MSIFNNFLTLVGYYFIRESYTPVLLRRKAKSEAMSTPNSKRIFKIQYWQELFPQLSVGLVRPFQILIRRLTISISALHYIAAAIGAIAAPQVESRIMDWLYRSLDTKTTSMADQSFVFHGWCYLNTDWTVLVRLGD